MSIAHWKHNTKLRPDLEVHFKNLLAYAKQKNKVITIFDLEATTFLGRKNFGITEIGMVHIAPNGNIGVSGSLVNPENFISKEVIELTGITHEMVHKLKTWKDLWLEAVELIAKTHIVVGFNSQSFDTRALLDQHKRYSPDKELAELPFEEHIDIRLVYNRITGVQKGKLAEIAEQLGIDLNLFQGHRAINDAILTAKLMDAIMEKHPNFETYINKPEAVKAFNKITPESTDKKEPTERKTSQLKQDMQTMLLKEYSTGKEFNRSQLQPLADVLHLSYAEKTNDQLLTALSFELSMMIDKNILPVLKPSNELKASWLKTDLFKNLVNAAWSDPAKANKLAPALEMTEAAKLSEPFDYIELRWGLHEQGLRIIKPFTPADTHSPS